MGRPRYETQADRNREAAVAERFASNYNQMVVTKLPKGHRADYLANSKGTDVAYIEIKTRTCNSTTYDTYHVSKDKLQSLQKIAEKDGLRALLLVQWRDKAGWIEVGNFLANATFKRGGRWDRNDPFDVEEMAEVDISLFKFIR